MSENEDSGNDGAPDSSDDMPKGMRGGRYIRGLLNSASGAIPFFGGMISAAAGAWSEHEQEKINEFFRLWLKMLEGELQEKQETIVEIMSRLDMHDEAIKERVTSPEYQSLIRKGFRDWAGAESEDKRVFVRNILANAGATRLTTDDVVRLFLEWVKRYSELHFRVVKEIYNNGGITRGDVWDQLGRGEVREDSADADLFKLLFRELTLGGIIRQPRETDASGNFMRKRPARTRPSSAPRTMKSAFDDKESYELTELGEQFVHYAMTEVPVRIEYQAAMNPSAEETVHPSSEQPPAS